MICGGWLRESLFRRTKRPYVPQDPMTFFEISTARRASLQFDRPLMRTQFSFRKGCALP
jgi:hypothetical protein